MVGIIERLRALVAGGRDQEDDGEQAAADEAVREEIAIEELEATREAARVDAIYAISDTPGSPDDPTG